MTKKERIKYLETVCDNLRARRDEEICKRNEVEKRLSNAINEIDRQRRLLAEQEILIKQLREPIALVIKKGGF